MVQYVSLPNTLQYYVSLLFFHFLKYIKVYDKWMMSYCLRKSNPSAGPVSGGGMGKYIVIKSHIACEIIWMDMTWVCL
jgi:hypothetical protein